MSRPEQFLATHTSRTPLAAADGVDAFGAELPGLRPLVPSPVDVSRRIAADRVEPNASPTGAAGAALPDVAVVFAETARTAAGVLVLFATPDDAIADGAFRAVVDELAELPDELAPPPE